MPGQQPPQQQLPPCYADFQPLKAEAEKRGKAIQAATSKKDKATREEVCALFKNYSAAEAKLVKFIKDSGGTIDLALRSSEEERIVRTDAVTVDSFSERFRFRVPAVAEVRP